MSNFIVIEVPVRNIQRGSQKKIGRIRFSHIEKYGTIAFGIGHSDDMNGMVMPVHEFTKQNFREWLDNVTKVTTEDDEGWATDRYEFWVTPQDLALVSVWLDSTLLGL